MNDLAELANAIKRMLRYAREFTNPDTPLYLWDDRSGDLPAGYVVFDSLREEIDDAVATARGICIAMPDNPTANDAHAATLRYWEHFRGLFELLDSDDDEVSIDVETAIPLIVESANEALADCGVALERLWPKLAAHAEREAIRGFEDLAVDDIDSWGEFRHENNLLTTAYIEERFNVRGPALSRDKSARENRHPHPSGRGFVYRRRDVLDLAERLAK